ncbi:FeoA family protein [Psychromonas antarctica]|jgi:ferrous iron transport protein A|uniref:FeoA family protein n=1 Tax=Psychromonas antarctica TaxID=67573 RepID=UPI001EE79737|nr:FeoA family protein [Psychromonas antarctica]MCG6200907.1 ferrous iron transport protein A [Psychromonas antarctica]
MLLSELKVGQRACIVNMHDMEPIMRKKLLNLGFLPKAQIEMLRRAPMGDPVAIRCANSSIALRKSLVSKIKVELIA